MPLPVGVRHTSTKRQPLEARNAATPSAPGAVPSSPLRRSAGRAAAGGADEVGDAVGETEGGERAGADVVAAPHERVAALAVRGGERWATRGVEEQRSSAEVLVARRRDLRGLVRRDDPQVRSRRELDQMVAVVRVLAARGRRRCRHLRRGGRRRSRRRRSPRRPPGVRPRDGVQGGGRVGCEVDGDDAAVGRAVRAAKLVAVRRDGRVERLPDDTQAAPDALDLGPCDELQRERGRLGPGREVEAVQHAVAADGVQDAAGRVDRRRRRDAPGAAPVPEHLNRRERVPPPNGHCGAVQRVDATGLRCDVHGAREVQGRPEHQPVELRPPEPGQLGAREAAVDVVRQFVVAAVGQPRIRCRPPAPIGIAEPEAGRSRESAASTGATRAAAESTAAKPRPAPAADDCQRSRPVCAAARRANRAAALPAGAGTRATSSRRRGRRRRRRSRSPTPTGRGACPAGRGARGRRPRGDRRS